MIREEKEHGRREVDAVSFVRDASIPREGSIRPTAMIFRTNGKQIQPTLVISTSVCIAIKLTLFFTYASTVLRFG